MATYEEMMADLNNQKPSSSTTVKATPDSVTTTKVTDSPDGDSKVTTTATGALLRGILNGATLGLGDDALTGIAKATGIHDYGQDLRNDETADDAQHPVASTLGQIAGAIAPNLIPGAGEANDARLAGTIGRNVMRVYSNPIVNGAASAVGNSNDLTNGNLSGAAGQAVLGGAEGGTIGKALDLIGNKIATGAFGKAVQGMGHDSSDYADINPDTKPDISNWLNRQNVPTPSQYKMTSGNSGVIGQTFGDAIQNATRSNPSGLESNRMVMDAVNRNFPGAAARLSDDYTDPLSDQILKSVQANNPRGFNATTLKQALDDHINSALGSANLAGEARNQFGVMDGMNHMDDAHDIMNSPLYKMASDAAPIHNRMMQNVNPIPKENANSSLIRHALATGSTAAGLALGHIPGGIIGTALIEGGPVAARAVASKIGTRASENALNDTINAELPAISATRREIGNNIRDNSNNISIGLTNGTMSQGQPQNVPQGNNNPSPRDSIIDSFTRSPQDIEKARTVDLLRSKGLSDAAIAKIMGK